MRARRFPRKTQERVGCHQEVAERGLRAAQPHEGTSEPAVDTCCLSSVWNTGCLCGNEYCGLCRGKAQGIHPASFCGMQESVTVHFFQPVLSNY